MTTVAFDGHTLAADSQTTTGGVRGHAAKIAKSRQGFIVAGAGDYAVVREWIAWVRGGMRPENQPASAEDASIIVVDPQGRAKLFCGSTVAQPLPRKKWATGTGGEIALGAMAMGADARQAVKIACELDVYSGGRIVSLTPGLAT